MLKNKPQSQLRQLFSRRKKCSPQSNSNSKTVDEQENFVEMLYVVQSGAGYHDALGAGIYAAAKKEFILLVNPDGDNS